jgi:hypothetical protein
MWRSLIPVAAIAAATAFGLLRPDPAVAASGVCPPYTHAIDVSFRTDTPTPTHDNTLNITGIRNLIRSRGTMPAGPHVEALGVTFVEPAFGLSAQTQYEPRGRGYCVYLTRIDANFGFRSIDVYVASEYPPGTCEYNAILDHENQHVAINLRNLKYTAPRVRAELERLLSVEQPVYAADGQAATKQRLESLSRAMDSMLNDFGEALARDNAAIDTTGNYAAINDICHDWNRGNVWPNKPPERTRYR